MVVALESRLHACPLKILANKQILMFTSDHLDEEEQWSDDFVSILIIQLHTYSNHFQL